MDDLEVRGANLGGYAVLLQAFGFRSPRVETAWFPS